MDLTQPFHEDHTIMCTPHHTHARTTGAHLAKLYHTTPMRTPNPSALNAPSRGVSLEAMDVEVNLKGSKDGETAW